MSVETTEDAGNRLWHELGGEVVGRLADAALECCLIIDGRGAVRWASSGLCRRLDCTLPSLLGHGADKVIADLSPDLTQADIDALLAGGNRVLTTSGAQGGRVALQAYLQEVSGAVPEESFKVLILFDVTTLIEQLSTAERARAAIEHRLNYDVETGLPNERRLMEVLHAALRRPEDAGAPREAVGLMLVEVLDFDQILDIYGTDIGNEVIQELVAAVSCVLDSDTFTARTRQNEFAVLLPRVTSTQALVTTAENLVGQLAFEVETGTGDCRVSSVLSVSQMLPGAGSADQILNNARIAMSFRELPRRAGQVRLYEPEMRAALEARSRTYNELFAAIGRDEIVPFFQPQVRLSDRTVVGFEVLVRWRHPEQGLVPPGLFLEIAEETGLLPQIDSIVMHKALQCLATWHADGFPDARISLNCTGDS
ncbi:MAG: EAL domain-containing protein, partial [Planctomycetota bacterium]